MTETDETGDQQGFFLTKEEKETIEKQLISISDYQRLSSLLVWIGLTMVILHIAADLFFHVFN